MRNTKRNFKELQWQVEMYSRLYADLQKEHKDILKENEDLWSLCNTMEGNIELHKKRLQQEEKINAFLYELVGEFGDHFDMNDALIQGKYLSMHLNANHRIN